MTTPIGNNHETKTTIGTRVGQTIDEGVEKTAEFVNSITAKADEYYENVKKGAKKATNGMAPKDKIDVGLLATGQIYLYGLKKSIPIIKNAGQHVANLYDNARSYVDNVIEKFKALPLYQE